MAKYKIGDKVRILDGSNIIDYTGGWAGHMNKYIGVIASISYVAYVFSDGRISYSLSGYDFDNEYWFDERGLELVKDENDTMDISDKFKLGDVVINILNPQWGTGIICEVISPKAYIVMFQNDSTSIQLECNADELQLFSEAAGNALKNITSKISRMENNKMPNIINYTYNETTAVTTIKWSDGTKTTVRAEDPSTANGYTGFVAAYAKKAAGNNNTINKLYDEWAVKKPAREMKAQIKANAAALEEKRIAKKRKAKKEQYLIRKRAAEINKEYEAKKLANEKYGVPMDFKAGDSD